MYEKHGRPLEKIIRDIIQTKLISVKYRPYQTDNFYTALVRQNTLEKEIKAIVSNKAKEAKAKN